jgi:sodium-dependent dicarboxylate transporter 2/3/5
MFILFLAVTAIGIIMTVVASNTGAAILMIPIIIPLAQSLGVDPLPLVLLMTCGVSLDFMLPIGTPPSALAYAVGTIRTKDMIRAGIFLTVFVILLSSGVVSILT